MAERELDVVVWGATGFTGRLVAEYLAQRYGADGSLRWAIGGRSPERLEAVRRDLGLDVPLLVGDSDDGAFLAAMAERTRVVCTTVGPYARYGSKLVAAVARAGTRYCDLTGELPWMRRMIDAHEKEARESGAVIVHTCGFDCIPSDLGTLFVQREMQSREGHPADQVKYRVKASRGGMSGGTAASVLHLLDEAARDPRVRALLADPYALNPSDAPRGPDGPDLSAPAWDAHFDSWIGPFVMALVNTRVVRRTHALLGQPWGREFRYDEATLTGGGPLGLARAAALTVGLGTAMTAGRVAALRRVVARFLPAPGEGPSREERERGFFDIRLAGIRGGDVVLRARVQGDRDPGYGSTAKMLGESAVCLARDPLPVGGGFWTPASAMGEALIDRLTRNAGVTFSVESEASAA